MLKNLIPSLAIAAALVASGSALAANPNTTPATPATPASPATQPEKAPEKAPAKKKKRHKKSAPSKSSAHYGHTS